MSATRPAVLLARVAVARRRLTCLAGGRGRGGARLVTIYGGGGSGDGGMHTRCAHEGCRRPGEGSRLSLSSLSLSLFRPVASASNLGSARPRANTNASSLARVRPPRLIAPGRPRDTRRRWSFGEARAPLTNTSSPPRSPPWKVAGSDPATSRTRPARSPRDEKARNVRVSRENAIGFRREYPDRAFFSVSLFDDLGAFDNFYNSIMSALTTFLKRRQSVNIH